MLRCDMSEILNATVEFTGGMAFKATGTAGTPVVMDASPESGGEGRGPKPMELLLFGLGGCTGMDVISILHKKRQDVTDYRIKIRGTRRADYPMVFTDITVEHIVRGYEIDPGAVRRAVELSATKYCSAAAMLGAVARITESYRVIHE